MRTSIVPADARRGGRRAGVRKRAYPIEKRGRAPRTWAEHRQELGELACARFGRAVGGQRPCTLYGVVVVKVLARLRLGRKGKPDLQPVDLRGHLGCAKRSQRAWHSHTYHLRARTLLLGTCASVRAASPVESGPRRNTRRSSSSSASRARVRLNAWRWRAAGGRVAKVRERVQVSGGVQVSGIGSQGS